MSEVVTITATRDELLGRIASALCDIHAHTCGVDRDDVWKLHANDFYAEAFPILVALKGDTP
jgi:hypothetical protein